MSISVWFTRDGKACIWGGKNEYGEMGFGNYERVSQPKILPPPLDSPWMWFAWGSYHVFAMTKSGKLFAWGRNISGELGIGISGGFINKPRLLLPPGKFPWIKIYCGSTFAIGITADGKAYIWGDDSFSQVRGSTGVRRSKDTRRHFSTPQLIPPPSGSHSWKTFYCGHSHAIGETDDGRFFAWGNNDSWQTGAQTKEQQTIHPLPLPDDEQIAIWDQFFCGINFTIGKTRDGNVYRWIRNADGHFIVKLESKWYRLYGNHSSDSIVGMLKKNGFVYLLKFDDSSLHPKLTLLDKSLRWKSFVVTKTNIFGVVYESDGDIYRIIPTTLKEIFLSPPPNSSWSDKEGRFLNPTFPETFQTFHERRIQIILLFIQEGDELSLKHSQCANSLISLRCPQLLDPSISENMNPAIISYMLALVFGLPMRKDIDQDTLSALFEFVETHQLVDFRSEIIDAMMRFAISRSKGENILKKYAGKLGKNSKMLDLSFWKGLVQENSPTKIKEKKTFSDYLRILYETRHESDCTLVVGEKTFPVHQFILSGNDFFRQFFEKMNHNLNHLPPGYQINCSEILSHDTANILIEYMYCGYVTTKITKEAAERILRDRNQFMLDEKRDHILIYSCKDALHNQS